MICDRGAQKGASDSAKQTPVVALTTDEFEALFKDRWLRFRKQAISGLMKSYNKHSEAAEDMLCELYGGLGRVPEPINAYLRKQTIGFEGVDNVITLAEWHQKFPVTVIDPLSPNQKIELTSVRQCVDLSIGILEELIRSANDIVRHLLYVACTRARDHLLVTSGDEPSEFLDDLRT